MRYIHVLVQFVTQFLHSASGVHEPGCDTDPAGRNSPSFCCRPNTKRPVSLRRRRHLVGRVGHLDGAARLDVGAPLGLDGRLDLRLHRPEDERERDDEDRGDEHDEDDGGHQTEDEDGRANDNQETVAESALRRGRVFGMRTLRAREASQARTGRGWQKTRIPFRGVSFRLSASTKNSTNGPA